MPSLKPLLLLGGSLIALGACQPLDEPQSLIDARVDDARPRPMPQLDAAPMTNCPPGQEAMGEFCNGKDDDCDGLVDEGFTNCQDPDRCQNGRERDCSTECGQGTQVCISEVWSECQTMTLNEEFCNLADDDCDGQVDEGDVCRMDAGVSMDAGDARSDAALDATVDAAPPVDMAGPPPPECLGHLDCGDTQFCFRQSCIASLPGTYVFTMLSARFDGEEINDPWGGGDPDIFATISVGEDELARTQVVEGENSVQWNERLEVSLQRQDLITMCVLDDDNFLGGGDDEVGCLEFTAENIADAIRRFEGDRPANQSLWALLSPPPPPRGSHLTELRFSVERLIRQ